MSTLGTMIDMAVGALRRTVPARPPRIALLVAAAAASPALVPAATPLMPAHRRSGSLHAQQHSAPLRVDATLRPGYHGAWRTDRSGITSEAHDLRLRSQTGAWWTGSPAVALRLRVAGRLSTDQETFRFYVADYIPTTDGLRLGEFTLDEAHVRLRSGDWFQLRVGRMQTVFELAGVPRKSLDRNDSPNTDVSWTDGVHAAVLVSKGWRQHLILQRNGNRGPTNVVRSPLEVTGDGSDVTVFTALQLDRRWGPFIQRELGLTWIPNAVPPAVGDASRDDYVAFVARGAVQLPLQVLGGRTVVGAEVGAAARAPTREALRTGTETDGRGDATAFQVSANLMEMRRTHSLGVVYSQAGDAWLISPDVRENNREVEARYYWQYARWGRLDVRFRNRHDVRARPGAAQRRHDRDVYVRTTLRF